MGMAIRLIICVVGVATVIFGGLYALTTTTSLPAYEVWFTGLALFYGVAFLVANVVGVMFLQARSRLYQTCYAGIVILLTGFAWWNAADRAATAKQETKLTGETYRAVNEIAQAIDVKPKEEASEMAAVAYETKVRGMGMVGVDTDLYWELIS